MLWLTHLYGLNGINREKVTNAGDSFYEGRIQDFSNNWSAGAIGGGRGVRGSLEEAYDATT